MAEDKPRERPILFSAPMVRALLEGRKTQTRRAVKDDWKPGIDRHWMFVDDRRAAQYCPYGAPGERLWVKETYASERQEQAGTGAVRWLHPDGKQCGALYRADAIRESAPGMGWKPSIHMPRCLSRIELEVTRARIGKRHDITDADAVAEGCNDQDREYWSAYDPVSDGYVDVFVEPGPDSELKAVRHHTVKADAPREQFRRLWWSINGAESWEANPWVWVVEFKRVRP